MTDMTTASAERDALRDAIAARETAEENLRKTREAAARAAQLATDCQAEVDSFNDAGARATANRAEQIKAAMRAGAEGAGMGLPASSSQRFAAKAAADAEAEADAARAAHTMLAEEVTAAEQVHATAAHAVHGAVLAVLRADSTTLGKQLVEIEERAYALRRALHSYSSCRVAQPGTETFGPLPLEPETAWMLQGAPKNVEVWDAPAAVKQWASYYAALSNDASATCFNQSGTP